MISTFVVVRLIFVGIILLLLTTAHWFGKRSMRQFCDDLKESVRHYKKFEGFYAAEKKRANEFIAAYNKKYDEEATLHNTLVRIRNHTLKLPIRELFTEIDKETANFVKHKPLKNPPSGRGAHTIGVSMEDGSLVHKTQKLGRRT